MPLRPPAGFIRPGFDPLKNPNAPTAVAATAGNTSASVAFTPPANVGGSAITEYQAITYTGGTYVKNASAASSPISVTGLTNGTEYTFQVWALNSYGPGPFSAMSGGVIPAVPTRGLFAGGWNGASTSYNTIDYISIATTGTSTDFGDLTIRRQQIGAGSSSTRGVFSSGYSYSNGGYNNTMDYVTIATTGNATDFGDNSNVQRSNGGCSSSTRAIWAGGLNSSSSTLATMSYITIASTGNTTFFGNLTEARYSLAGLASTTRGVFAGGFSLDTFLNYNTIDYVTIASTGSATDFGDLINTRNSLTGFSNSTRGIFAGGTNNSNVIQYITIASTGNAIDFGDLLTSVTLSPAGCASPLIGVVGGGYGNSDVPLNVIESIVIATTGNATDFGDLTQSRGQLAACSNGHGGL